MPIDQADVGTVWDACLVELLEYRRKVVIKPPVEAGRQLRGLGSGPGQEPVVVGAVCHMVVDVNVGLPPVDEGCQSDSLHGVQLEVVAVEVETGDCCPEAHSTDGSMLIGPVGRGDVFVAVGVVDRREEDDACIEQVGVSAEHDVTENHHRRGLAVDLSRMNAALDQHDGLAGGMRGFWGEQPVFGYDDQG